MLCNRHTISHCVVSVFSSLSRQQQFKQSTTQSAASSILKWSFEACGVTASPCRRGQTQIIRHAVFFDPSLGILARAPARVYEPFSPPARRHFPSSAATSPPSLIFSLSLGGSITGCHDDETTHAGVSQCVCVCVFAVR